MTAGYADTNGERVGPRDGSGSAGVVVVDSSPTADGEYLRVDDLDGLITNLEAARVRVGSGSGPVQFRIAIAYRDLVAMGGEDIDPFGEVLGVTVAASGHVYIDIRPEMLGERQGTLL